MGPKASCLLHIDHLNSRNWKQKAETHCKSFPSREKQDFVKVTILSLSGIFPTVSLFGYGTSLPSSGSVGSSQTRVQSIWIYKDHVIIHCNRAEYCHIVQKNTLKRMARSNDMRLASSTLCMSDSNEKFSKFPLSPETLFIFITLSGLWVQGTLEDGRDIPVHTALPRNFKKIIDFTWLIISTLWLIR